MNRSKGMAQGFSRVPHEISKMTAGSSFGANAGAGSDVSSDALGSNSTIARKPGSHKVKESNSTLQPISAVVLQPLNRPDAAIMRPLAPLNTRSQASSSPMQPLPLIPVSQNTEVDAVLIIDLKNKEREYDIDG
jgi:hypothetical protein